MSDNKTIEIVVPDYIYQIVTTEKVLTQDKIGSILSQLGKYSSKRLQATASEYLRFLCNRLGTYEYLDNSDLYRRTSDGDALEKLTRINERKFKMLEYLQRDKVFSKFFEFTSKEKSAAEITREFNAASGRSLIKWGAWLGATLYTPFTEKFRSFITLRVITQDVFWSSLVAGYKRLQRRSSFENLRFNISIPELRAEVCADLEIMPLSFDETLIQLIESKKKIEKIELVGMPLHKFHNIGAKHLEPLIIRGRAYYYVILH